MMKYILALSLVVLLFGCVGQTDAQASTTGPQNTQNTVTTGKLVEINMVAKKWSFEPSTVTVNKGDHVKISLTSADIEHGFMLKDYGINVKIEPGQITMVDFIANKSGEFGFRCSVMCGEGHMQQTGMLVVK